MHSETIEVPGCRGTSIRHVFEDGNVQVLMVQVDPGGEIPLHSHDCAATMVVTRGEARVLGKDGRVVRSGDVVVKASREPHGFTDVKEPFAFLSISDGRGIAHTNGWDMEYL